MIYTKISREVIKAVRSEQEKFQYELISHGWFFSVILQNTLLELNSAWSSVQTKLPKDIFDKILQRRLRREIKGE